MTGGVRGRSGSDLLLFLWAWHMAGSQSDLSRMQIGHGSSWPSRENLAALVYRVCVHFCLTIRQPLLPPFLKDQMAHAAIFHPQVCTRAAPFEGPPHGCATFPVPLPLDSFKSFGTELPVSSDRVSCLPHGWGSPQLAYLLCWILTAGFLVCLLQIINSSGQELCLPFPFPALSTATDTL